jgi:radical SAM protein with 4Fe4S-binding SPASM domain
VAELDHATALMLHAHRRAIPLEVVLELTHRCTFRCCHCYLPARRENDEVPLRRWLALLEELAAAGTLYLTLTGGEVLLSPHWQAIATEARRLGFALTVLSNGELVDKGSADALAALSATVEISLYSTDRQVFDSVTGARGGLPRVLRGVRLLADRGVEVVFKVPLLEAAISGLDGVFAQAAELGVACRAYSRLVSPPTARGNPAACRLAPARLHDFYRGPYSACLAPADCELSLAPDMAVCAAGVRVANVTPAGNVLACTILPGVAGNIMAQGFSEIWCGSPWLRRLRSIRRPELEECDTCSRFAYCKRCPAQALLEDGNLLGPARWSCEHAEALERAFARGA